MLVKQGKEIARQWVLDEGSRLPGFWGAFFIGSINWKNDDTDLPLASDIDLRIVIDGNEPPDEVLGFSYHNVLLEVSYSSSKEFQSPETVLSEYPFACHFTTPNIIVDPSGKLTEIHKIVSRDFAKRKWVYKRCENARNLALTSLKWLIATDPLHDQVFSWLYSVGLPTHIILTAGLKNPTFRKCLVESKEVLDRFGHLDLHDEMLSNLGSSKMNQEQVETHLYALTEVFDIAKEIVKTPFFLSTDISDCGRPKIIDGSKQLIDAGYYREAIAWIGTFFSCCQKVIYNDAPDDVQNKLFPLYKHFLSDLGIESYSDLQKRSEQSRVLIDTSWNVAEAIIAANPEVVN